MSAQLAQALRRIKQKLTGQVNAAEEHVFVISMRDAITRDFLDEINDALDAHEAAPQQEPAGYVTAIEEGKVLMLPRSSLNTDPLVPVYAAPQQAQAPTPEVCDFVQVEGLGKLPRSDAESWLRHRAGIIEACRAEGYSIVTTAQGVRLMKLGKIEAQAPGWQPIETAPENTEREVVVQWMDSDGAICRDLDYREDGCWMGWHNHAEHVEVIGGHGVSYTPPYTEWMPIPAPQQGSKTE